MYNDLLFIHFIRNRRCSNLLTVSSVFRNYADNIDDEPSTACALHANVFCRVFMRIYKNSRLEMGCATRRYQIFQFVCNTRGLKVEILSTSKPTPLTHFSKDAPKFFILKLVLCIRPQSMVICCNLFLKRTSRIFPIKKIE